LFELAGGTNGGAQDVESVGELRVGDHEWRQQSYTLPYVPHEIAMTPFWLQ